VVVYDIQDELDADPVQRLDLVTELVERTEGISPRAVGGMEREERQRLVARLRGFARRLARWLQVNDCLLGLW
jgi:hypothetical protein